MPIRRLVGLVVLFLVGCPDAHPGDVLGDGGAGDAEALVELTEYEELLAALDRGEERVVLVLEEEAPDPHALATGRAAAPARDWIAGFVPEEDWVLRAVHLPIVAMRVRDRATLEAIERVPGVRRVEPDRAHTASVLPSLTMIGQPAAIARGADGRGYSVAVLDTGADYTHPDLGACAAAGPACPVVVAQDFATADGTLDDSVRHGTNVSAIVHLVAPGARIIALDVFVGRTASSTHIAAALDWVIANRSTHAIAAINMSLGYGGFTGPCPDDVLAVAVQRVRAAGIVPVVASGNSYYADALASPACAPAAVSVGAVDGAGVPASFSNAASFLTLMAPGTSISAGGVNMSGTSQAAPHVAGSIVALLSAYPSDGVDALVARLVGTGVTTPDARNGLSFRCIALDAASAGGATAPPPDVTAPTATFTFAGPFARTTSAPFTIVATDASAIASMCLSATTTCTAFVPYAPSASFTLPTGDGLKTVRLWLRDAAGNTMAAPATATITLDTRVPTAGTMTAVAGVRQVTLSATGATDTGSGIALYRVVWSTGTTAPATCSAGTLLAESAGPSWTHTGLTAGTTYRYRICAVDRAGNLSPGATATAMPVAELDAPSGTVVIEGGATWSRSTRVTVQLTATDASAVTSVCLTSTATATCSWLPFLASRTVTLAGTGMQTLFARFRDTWGNVSSAVSDTISVDTTGPASPVVRVEPRGASLLLSWPEGSDTPSGLSGYVVAHALGTTAPACTGGAAVSPASAGTRQHLITGLTNGATYSYRVCAVDVAGNVSAGTTGRAVPAPELVPPVAEAITIAGGAPWTRTSSVVLTLRATDPGGVASVCLSTTTSCTAWLPYAESRTFSLGSTAGTRTVSAWFRDAYGNTTTTPISDTIGYDAVAPTNPTVTATARSGAVGLSFTASTDATSGVAGYLVAWGSGTTAPPCAGGTAVSTATRALTISSSTLVRFRVCALDAAGNTSAGAVGSSTPLP